MMHELVSNSLPHTPAVAAPPGHLRELEMARQVQQHLFPRELPQLPGFEFAAMCRPARQVAGDYYDLFEVEPGWVAIALGDVSGKGLGPALVASGLHAFVRSRLSATVNLAVLAALVNRYLIPSTPPDLFATLFLGLLDVRTGEMRYVNAGHPAPLLLPTPDAPQRRLDSGGPLLGIFADAEYAEGRVTLTPGALLAVFSDGLTEAQGDDGELFREPRVVEAVRAAQPWSASAVLSRVLASVGPFAATQEPDDVTLVIVHRQCRQVK